MNKIARWLASSLVAGLAAVSAGSAIAEPAEVRWSDLAPPVAEISNPFESLTNEQMDALRRIIRLEWVGDAKKTAEANALRADLAAQGLDVEGLFAARLKIIEQRRQATSSLNEAILGKEVRIPGYVLPLEMRDRKAVEFLLVPTVGACIHTPPPPANQLIHVVHPEGIEIKGLYDPVWVTGVVEAGRSTKNVRYSDGQTKVEVGYGMRHASVVLIHPH